MLQAAMAPGALTAPFLMDTGPAVPGLAPPAIRVEVAKCVAANRMTEAERMLTEGLRRFPDSEDLLVMRALISEVQLDWAAADITLQRLLSVQGSQAPVASWLHWVRVLRCMQRRDRATEAMHMALKYHPQDEALRAEAAALGVPPPPLKRKAA
jgi:hypothetical protein